MAQDVKINLEFVAKNIEQINKRIGNMETSLKRAGGTNSLFKRLQGTFDRLKFNVIALNQAISLAGRIARTTTGFFGKFIKEASKIEDLTVQFQTLTGSLENAKDLIADLQTFAARTPFKLQGIAEASRALLAFGFEQDEIIDRLRELGDVAAAAGADLFDIAFVFGQVRAAGKLTGERLVQLGEKGIPIIAALAAEMGVAEKSVRDLVSKGAVDFRTFQKAFAGLSKEGGKFFKGMERQSQTLSGRLSTLSDNIDQLFSNIGETMVPVLKQVVTGITNFIQENQKEIIAFSKAIIVGFLEGFRDLLSFVRKVRTFVKEQFGEATKEIEESSKKLTKSKLELQTFIPTGGFTAPIVISKGDSAKKVLDEVREKHQKLKDSFKDTDPIKKFEDKLEQLITKFKDTEIVVRVKAEPVDEKEQQKKRTEEFSTAFGGEQGGLIGESLKNAAQQGVVKQGFIDAIINGAKKFAIRIGKGFEQYGKDLALRIKDAVADISNLGFGGAMTGLAGLATQGEAGALQLAGMAGDLIAPGLGQAIQIFGQDTEKFRESINQFFDVIAELPQRLAENLPYFWEKVVESLPIVIDAFSEAIPIIVEKISDLLSQPSFWENVTKALTRVLLIQMSSPAFWAFVAASAAEAFIKAVPDIVDAIIDGIKDGLSELGGVLGGGGGGFLGGFGDFVGGVGDVFGFQKGFDVPDMAKFANDNFGPVSLSAGEAVLRKNTSDRLDEFMDIMTKGGQDKNLIVNLQVGEQELSQVMLSLNQRGFRVA